MIGVLAMKHAFLTLSLVLVAAFAAVPPARAEEHEARHDEHEKPQKKHPPVAKPKAKPKPKSAPPAKPHAPVKPGAPAKPGAQAKQPPAEAVRPTPTPRPVSAANPQRTSPSPMMPAPKAPAPGLPAPVQALPKPQPITDPKHFLRRWAPPPAPKTGEAGAPLTATPVTQVPTSQHTTVFNNTTVVTNIISNQQNEVAPNRYYWHHDGGYDYVHSYSGGAHWYGFYVGPNYYWSQHHANRWWWYDPIAQRYLYFNGGYWWWQNPSQPGALYVYQSGAYVPYAVAAAAAQAAPVGVAVNAKPAASPAPPAPKYHSDVDAPNYSVDPNANRFAVVVGVEDYAGLPRAAFAARDAAAVRAHLSALGYPDQNIVMLTSTSAARGGIAKAVESWLPEHVNDRSRVFVYFAGDGAPDPKTGVAYLLPWDGDVKNLASTGYSLKQLYAALNALPAKEIVVALDSGFSGTGGRSVRAAGAPPLAANIDVGRGFAGRIVVFSAAGADEIAGTLPDQGHGLFTYNFLKGLNGEAAQTADGVTVQGLFDFLTPGVEDAAGRDHRGQTPQLIVPPDGQRKLLIKDLR
jgi:hypothetical protein